MQMLYSVLFCLLVTAMTGNGTKVIVISVGALRYDHLLYTPKIKHNLMQSAHAKILLPVMPPKGPVNHWSIATGLYAEDHGVIDDCRFDEPKNECNYGKPDVTKTPVWIKNEYQGGTSAVMNWPGADLTYSDRRPTYYENYKDDHSKNRETQIDKRINTIKGWLENIEKPANLVMVYYDELDKVLHEDTIVSLTGQEEVKFLEYFIDKLIDDVKKMPDVNLIILGTHGGEKVDKYDGIDLNEILSSKNAHFDALGANAIVTPKEGQSIKVYNILKNTAKNTKNYDVYYGADIPRDWHLKNMPLFENSIFLVAHLKTFFWNDYLRGIQNNKHFYPHNRMKVTVDGYPDDSINQTFFMAMGPNFVSAKEVPAFYTIDVYPLLINLLQLPESEDAENEYAESENDENEKVKLRREAVKQLLKPVEENTETGLLDKVKQKLKINFNWV